MKIEKEKGFFRKFLDWLSTPDEDEIKDGKINIRAFKGEDKECINALNETTKRVDHTASTEFTDKDEQRAVTIKGMKADVKTPKIEAKAKRSQIVENDLVK